MASGAILGGPPQDTKYQGEETFLRIGERNIIREGVTIHRATGEGNATIVGNENMIMAYAHVGHNACLGSNITIASYVGISGHATVEDRVVFGGFVGVHQFVRIGKMTMIGGMSRVVQDVPPFMLVQGEQLQPHGLNVIGLRRAGVTAEVREQLKEAYRLLYRAGLNLQQAVERIRAEVPPSAERDYLVSFLQRCTRAGTGASSTSPSDTVRIVIRPAKPRATVRRRTTRASSRPDRTLWYPGRGPRMRRAVTLVRDSSAWGSIGVANALRFASCPCGLRRPAPPPACAPACRCGADRFRRLQRARRSFRAHSRHPVYFIAPGSWRRSGPINPSLLEAADYFCTQIPWHAERLRAAGAHAEFYGHPLLDLAFPSQPPEAIRRTWGLEADAPVVCILPGSRRHEVEHILPALLDAAALVRDQVPGTHFVLGLAEVVDRGQVGRILRACGWSAREPAEGQGGPRPGATPLAASSRGRTRGGGDHRADL